MLRFPKYIAAPRQTKRLNKMRLVQMAGIIKRTKAYRISLASTETRGGTSHV